MDPDEKKKQLVDLRNGNLIIENANEYWSEEDIRKSKDMFEHGYGISEIALVLKRTEVSVTCSLQNRGFFAKQCRPRYKSDNADSVNCLCSKCKRTDCPYKGGGSKNCKQFQSSDNANS